MKKNKLFLALGVVTILVIGMSTAVFAATENKTPAEIVAGLTGKTTDEVTTDRQAGIPYGAQALAADKLEEFKAERLTLYEQNLKQDVLDGTRTQAEADKLLEEMKLRMADCDGTGTGSGQGVCDGTGSGQGVCDGTGIGARNGIENGRCDGTGQNSENDGTGMRMGRGAGNGSGLGCGSCTD